MTDQRTTSLDVLEERVARLRERPVPATDKAVGWLAAAGPVTSAGLAAARPAIWDFELPVMVAHESALAHNIEAMATYCAAAGVSHAPHGKTPMAPQLVARQLAAGAWAVSAATAAQARVFRSFGVPRVLIASQLTTRPAIEWLGRELAADPGFECYTYADSLAGVALLDEGLRAVTPGRPLPVLVELGYPGGRTGCRSIDEALAVAAAVHDADGLELAGAAGFEGGIERGDLDATLAAVALFIIDLRTLGERLPGFADGGGRLPILSAGGSSFFDVVCRELAPADARVVLRSGAYVAHDHGHYAESGPASRPTLPGLPSEPRVRGRAGAVGGRAVGARAGTGHRQRRPPRHLLRPGHARAAAGAPVRGDRARGRNAADQPRRPARLPEHHRQHRPAGPRRPGQPGQHPPVHDHGQVAGHPGGRRRRPGHRRRAHLLLAASRQLPAVGRAGR